MVKVVVADELWKQLRCGDKAHNMNRARYLKRREPNVWRGPVRLVAQAVEQAKQVRHRLVMSGSIIEAT